MDLIRVSKLTWLPHTFSTIHTRTYLPHPTLVVTKPHANPNPHHILLGAPACHVPLIPHVTFHSHTHVIGRIHSLDVEKDRSTTKHIITHKVIVSLIIIINKFGY